MFPAIIVREGQTAAGPSPKNCAGDVDPRTDTLSDAALSLFAFKGYRIEETIDSCVELHGDGDKRKTNQIMSDFSSLTLCYRMRHVLEGLSGTDRSQSYGPRMRDVSAS
ncbi:hypothetical protein PABG_12223 [Paracoccidioides brasiliensis Pb03]|nr:hypothetical protein PABG_12223 [Paracoccidioides brasiliensis Pb03]